MLNKLFSATALNALGFGLGFFVQLLLARLLPVEEFGLFSFFFALNMTISLVALMGFPQAVMRLIPTFKNKTHAGNLWWLTLTGCLGLAALLGAATYGVLYILGLPEDAPKALYLWAFAPLIPLVLLRLQTGFLKALKKPLIAIFYEITGREILLLSGLVTAALIGLALHAAHIFTLLLVVFSALGIFALLHTANTIKPKASRAVLKKQSWGWTLIALPMMLTVFAQMLMHRTDILMVGLMLSAFDTGIYGLATKLSQVVGFPMLAMTAIFSPHAAKLYKDKKHKELKSFFNQNRLFLVLTTLALSAGLVVFAPYVLPFFGQDYSASYDALIILLVGNIINAFWGPVVLTMIMSEHEKTTMYVTIAAAVFNIALNASLIPTFGIEGAALATAITMNLKNIVLSFYMHKAAVLRSA